MGWSKEWDAATVRMIPGIVERRLAEEAKWLFDVGFMTPFTLKSLRIEPTVPQSTVHLPTFIIPNYLDITVRDGGNHVEHRHYCIADTPQRLEAAKTDLEQHGLAFVVERYRGAWTNRGPYDFYKRLNNLCEMSCSSFQSGKWPEDLYASYTNPDLRRLPGWDAALVRRLDRRTEFIDRIFPGSFRYQPNPDAPSVFSLRFTDFWLFEIEIPDWLLADKRTSFKMLPGTEPSSGVTEQWLESLRQMDSTICFEIRNTPQSVYYRITVDSQEADRFSEHFALYFPEFALIPELSESPLDQKDYFCITAYPTHATESIKGFRAFALDPYLSLFNQFDRSPRHEGLQIYFAPLKDSVVKGFSSFSEKTGGEITKKSPTWLLAIKLYSDDEARLQKFASFLNQFETAEQSWVVSQIQRQPVVEQLSPAWNVVATSELASLAHFPGKEIESNRLERMNMKSKLPPENFTQGDVRVGISEARGVTVPVTLPAAVRDRHLYIVGKSGMGKSTLIANAVIANIRAGEGCCVIDPHGDLIATGSHPLLDYVPHKRVTDTVYFNVADKEYPLALNLLAAREDDELSLLADNLLVTFRRLSDSSWGPRMDDILRATLQTLMHIPGTSFLDIKRLLHNDEFRQSVIRRLQHPMLREFWEDDFPRYAKDASAPIVSRVNKFLYLPQLYTMLSSAESKLDFYDVIENKKILLVNLASGSIGEDNAELIGSMIVTQLQMAIMRRASVASDRRHPFYLYVDEFQNFTTSSFEKILSEARKYKLCLTLAHQFISQIPDSQRDAIFGNVGTMIMFSCGDKDAPALRYQLGSFEPQDLVSLKKFEALCRPESSQDTFRFQTIPAPERPDGHSAAIIDYTRRHYTAVKQSNGQELSKPAPKSETRSEDFDNPAPALAAILNPVQTPPPAAARQPEGVTRVERVLQQVQQAGYLSTQQLIELCFDDLASVSSRKKSASILLGRLEEQRQLSSIPFEREKIWYLGRRPNVRRHDLTVRDIFVRIAKTGWEIAEAKFFNSLPGSGILNPDLSVTFASENGTAIETLWEFDNNTEGDEVLLSKLARYQSRLETHKVIFVFADESRIVKLAGKMSRPGLPIYHASLSRLAIREDSFGLFSMDLGYRVRLF